MPKSAKRPKKSATANPQPSGPQDRAPYQQNSDRDPIKSAEETRHVPTQHGTIK